MATPTTGPATTEDGEPQPRRRSITVPGILLGLGLGGFIDGIVLHQILQWHHMGTSYGEHASFPMSTVSSLEDNTLWDGLFHIGTWLFVIVGLYLLWRAAGQGIHAGLRSLTGLLLAGWGIFNVVEGVIDHLVLGIHHVRDDLGGPLSWDLGFVLFGLILVVVGWALHRSDPASARSGL